MSTSACIAILAKRSLYGSPAIENIGNFCDTTKELNTSIMGIPVRIILSGIILFTGLTGGPPISTTFSESVGPLSSGTPLPLKIRPKRFFPLAMRIGCPRKLTLSSVDIPRLPAKTCKDTLFPSRRITCASEVPRLVVISAISL